MLLVSRSFRSKQIESACFSGTAAFMEVRIQSVVVEFILNHVDVLFSTKLSSLIREGAGKQSAATQGFQTWTLFLVSFHLRYQDTTLCLGPNPCWYHRLLPNSWASRKPRPEPRPRSTLLWLRTASTSRWAKVRLPCRASSTPSSSFPPRGLSRYVCTVNECFISNC